MDALSAGADGYLAKSGAGSQYADQVRLVLFIQ